LQRGAGFERISAVGKRACACDAAQRGSIFYGESARSEFHGRTTDEEFSGLDDGVAGVVVRTGQTHLATASLDEVGVGGDDARPAPVGVIAESPGVGP